jgi:glutamate dehydrogenase
VTHPRSIGYAAKITDLFLRRFDPENKGNDETEFRESLNEIRDEIASNVQVSYVKEILMGMTEILEKTYKTNVYMNDRYALSLRLCPSIMGVGMEEDSTLPYGILFVSFHFIYLFYDEGILLYFL